MWLYLFKTYSKIYYPDDFQLIDYLDLLIYFKYFLMFCRSFF